MGWQGDLMPDALRGMGAGLFIWSLMGSEGRGEGWGRMGLGLNPKDALSPENGTLSDTVRFWLVFPKTLLSHGRKPENP
jgi:hypothetical protein